jgi:hypothetical protein
MLGIFAARLPGAHEWRPIALLGPVALAVLLAAVTVLSLR